MNINMDRKLAQQIVNTVKDVCGHDINFIDCSGKIFASTDEQRIGTFHEIAQQAAITGSTLEVEEDNSFVGTYKGVNLPIYHKNSIIAVIGISGKPAVVRKYAHLAERITKLLIREQELNTFNRTESDKKNYIIHSLIRNTKVNPKYVSDALNSWNINLHSDKRLVIIHLNPNYNLANLSMIEQLIQQFFASAEITLFTNSYPNDFLAVIDQEDFTVKESLLKKFADTYAEILAIAVGKTTSLYKISQSYDSCMITLKSLSCSKESYAAFDHLTLEIILSGIDRENKTDYQNRTIAALSEHEIQILTAYFEEDTALSAASEKLFIHKNTLQNKLDKISDKTGYNPRKFRDAVLLYLAVKMK